MSQAISNYDSVQKITIAANIFRENENMALSISYALAANKVITDAVSNKLSVIDIFDAVVIPKDSDKTVLFFQIASRIDGFEGGDVSIEIIIEHEEGLLVAKTNLNASNLKKGSININAYFSGVPFSKIGKNYIKIICNGILIPDDNKNFITVINGG